MANAYDPQYGQEALLAGGHGTRLLPGKQSQNDLELAGICRS